MKKYFDWEQAFHYIWNNTDHEGIWKGDATALANEFSVFQDSAHSVLSELCDRRLIELVGERCYAIVNWPEKRELGDEYDYS